MTDDGLSDVDDLQHPTLGEVTSGLEGISASPVTRAAMATLDAVDLSELGQNLVGIPRDSRPTIVRWH